MSWILFAYLSLLALFLLGYVLTARFYKLPLADTVPLSIIISARNEEATIEACLQSILKQAYDPELIELIVIDDGSSDATSAIAGAVLQDAPFYYKVLRNETAIGKKRSLARGISETTHALIITRDADTYCENTEYLRTIADFYEREQMDVIIAPIAITAEKGLLNLLQRLENQVLRIFTAGSAYFQFPFISSGANFAFSRECYTTVGGYSSHLHIASGDDVFFLQEVSKQKQFKIGFLKAPEALVYTYPARSFKKSLQQRARWSSKVLKRPTLPALASGSLILVTNLLFLYALVQLFINPQRSGSLFLIFKAGMDFFLLFLGRKGFEKPASLLQILVMVLVYPFYMLLSSVAAIFTKPVWK